jgi:hypothetical protein
MTDECCRHERRLVHEQIPSGWQATALRGQTHGDDCQTDEYADQHQCDHDTSRDQQDGIAAGVQFRHVFAPTETNEAPEHGLNVAQEIHAESADVPAIAESHAVRGITRTMKVSSSVADEVSDRVRDDAMLLRSLAGALPFYAYAGWSTSLVPLAHDAITSRTLPISVSP